MEPATVSVCAGSRSRALPPPPPAGRSAWRSRRGAACGAPRPTRRFEEPGSWEQDAPRALPDGVLDDDVQRVRDGAGPLFHRRYCARIRDPECSPEELMAQLQESPDRAAPSEFATFKKTRGPGGQMRVGDEYVVRMPGTVGRARPGGGGLRTAPSCSSPSTATSRRARSASSRRASRVDPVRDRVPGQGGDRLSNLLYDHLRMSKEIQLHMWMLFLERVIRLSGGSRDGPLSHRDAPRGAGAG